MLAPLSITLELTRDGEGWEPRAVPQSGQRYLLRVDGGGLEPTAPFPWDAQRAQDLRDLASADAEQRAQLGLALTRALEPAGWPAQGRRALEALEQGRHVVLSLRLNAAELLLMPWGLLELPDGTPIGERSGLLLRVAGPGVSPRALRTNERGRIDPRLAEGRVLFAWAGVVPHEAHWAALQAACAAGFRVPEELPEARLEDLVRALSEQPPYSVLHLLAHGSREGLELAGGVASPKRLAARLASFADRTRLVVLAACEGAKAGPPGSALGSVAEGLHQAGFEAVLAYRRPLSKLGSVALAEALYPPLLVGLKSLEEAVLLAREALPEADLEGQELWASGGVNTRPLLARPYRGLDVFDRAHHPFFFGREAEAAKVLADLDGLCASGKPRWLFVSGASGSGKSSLVRAGVLPKLEGRFAATVVQRPAQRLRDLPEARPLMLVLDQAEELFTQLSAAQRQTLVEELHALATDDSGSAVLLTLRVDYLGRTGELRLPDGRRLDQLAFDEAHRVFVLVMPRAQMLEAITEPARLAGLELEEGLAGQLVDEVSGEPGALPLLEFALDRAWAERKPGEGLTLEGYRALGGAVGALLEREADALVAGFTEDERAAARRLLVQLVATGEGQRSDTRRARQRSELGEGEVFERVLRRLADARLVVTGEAGRVEIAHEELIRRWGALREWVDADRQKWIEIERVRSWTHLLRGGQLDRAKEARARYGAELGEATLQHVAASEAAVAAEAERERQRQAELEAAKEAAEGEARRARNALRLAVAAQMEARDPSLALMFLAELELDSLPTWPGTELLLRRLLARSPPVLLRELLRRGARSAACCPNSRIVLTLLEEGEVLLWRGSSPAERLDVSTAVSMACAPDGSRLVTGTWEGAAQLWRMPEAAALGEPLRHEGAVRTVAFSRHGSRLLTVCDGGAVKLWSATDGASLGELPQHRGAFRFAAFSPDGSRVLTVSGDEVVSQWRVSDLSTLGEPLGVEGELRDVAYSPDGARILTVSEDSAVRLWCASDGSPVGEPVHHEEGVVSALFSPDKEQLATGSTFGRVHLRSASDGSPLGELDSHEGQLTAMAYSPCGSRLVTAGMDGTARVWCVRSGAPLGGPLQHEEPVRSVAFSPDGTRILTLLSDGSARTWRAPSGPPARAPLVHEAPVRFVAWSPDDSLILTGSKGDGTLRLWRASDGAAVGEPLRLQDGLGLAAWSPDEPLLLTVSERGEVRLWRLGEGSGFEALAMGEGSTLSLSSSPDGSPLVTSMEGGALRLWHVLTGASLKPELAEEWDALCLARSRDGARFVTGSKDGRVCVRRADDGASETEALLVRHLRSMGVACVPPHRRVEHLLEIEEEAEANHQACLEARKTTSDPIDQK